MEDALEELQNALLGLLKNVLMHEHYFGKVEAAYEVAVCRPMCLFPLIPQPAPLLYRSKSLKKPKTTPIPTDPQGPHMPRSLGIILNVPALSQVKASQPDFNHIVTDFKTRIRAAESAAQSSERVFGARLKSIGRVKAGGETLKWDREAAEGYAGARLLGDIGRLVSGEVGKQVLSACKSDDKSYYTLEEATQMLTFLHFLTWVEEELPKVKELVRKDSSRAICEQVKGLLLGNGTRTEGLFDDFKGEHRLLLRVKECAEWGQFRGLRREYERFCLWHAQAEVLKFVKMRVRGNEVTVQTLRSLLSILHTSGKSISTVEHAPSKPIK